MGSFKRITRYVKDFWKVIIRGENDDLQRQTLSMQEELARLRNRRTTSDKEREAAALNQARAAVQRMRELHNSFLAAEEAASEFGAKMGEVARSSMEAHAVTREQVYKKFFVKQKELYQQEVEPDMQGETGPPVSALPSQSNGQDEASKSPELKLSGPADGKETGSAAMVGNMPNEAGESLARPAVVQAAVEIIGEEVRQPIVSAMPEDVTSSSSSNKDAAVHKMDFTQEIPEDILAQMMQEVRKQVRLEEKSHLDALARDKAILEKEIEARETAERGSISHGHQ